MAAVLISQIANRYQILSLVGQGGMADVYRAKDTILNRIVAIKILRSKLSQDPMILVRFQREASAASRLSHPNVVDIYDVGEFEGFHYIVMEYVRGRTLKQLITQRGAINFNEAIDIMRQLVSAVAMAHSNNIIHRDIKPQNVLVKDDGTVKITDFGIAIDSDSVQLTSNNAVMGSAHYLAPETAQGMEPTAQVDIYSLGIVFYELLTGQVPYSGKTPTEIALQHLRQKIPYVRDFYPAIPQSVENIILKATAKDLSQRYSSADEMLYDLVHCRDLEYRNMERIKIDEKEISHVEVNKGKVKVQYDEKRKKEPAKRKTGFSKIVIGICSILILFLCSFLVLGLTGIISFGAIFGYLEMPDLSGCTQEEAIELLEDAGFDSDQIEIEKQPSDSVDEDYVIKANYDAKAYVDKEEEIVLTISSGGTYLIQDYTGQYLEDVEELFKEEGLLINVDVEYKPMADTNPGYILEQTGLEVGDRIDPDEEHTIHFVVTSYPEVVISSSWIGKDYQSVYEELNALGIAVVQSGSGSTIIATSPEIGTKYVQEGSSSYITLYTN